MGYGEPNAYNLLVHNINDDVPYTLENCFTESVNLLFQNIELLNYGLRNGIGPEAIAELRAVLISSMNFCRHILTEMGYPVL